jgi:predicted DNA-binding protein with PD1-like motif|tara:strand:- start:12684 stop:13109 length:426 start_codon:yes stop_codon:yes gene_type:complete
MQFKQDGNTFIIYVEQNEPIMETLTQFCKSQNIVNGQISGIGAVREINFGAYDLENKKYVRQLFDNLWELTSFQGNIILKNGEPSIHAHITISDHNLDVKGGHLFEAKVGAVGEFILKKIETNGKREFDPKIGLFCMEFNN